MSRGDQILRQWNLLRCLQSRGTGVPLKQLAEEAEVSDRTIQRDFEILQAAGFPLESEQDEIGKKYWRMPHKFIQNGPLVLSLTESISLHFADKMLSPLAGTYLAEGFGEILKKIRSQLPQKALDYFNTLDETIYVRRKGVTDYSASTDIIRTLVDAVREETTLEVQYHALWRGETYTTRLDPYGLIYYESNVFVMGYSHRAEAVRVFKVTRIRKASTTSDHFERPVDFSLEEKFRSSFGIIQDQGEPLEITVKFTGTATTLIEEKIWHESQQLTWLPSEEMLFDQLENDPNALLATYKLSNVIELVKWIKGFGEHAEVIKPDWLRVQIRDELQAAADKHK